MLTLADKPKIDINPLINQNIWYTSQDSALVNSATALIENPELLDKSLSVAKMLSELTVDANLLVAGIMYEPFNKKEISGPTIKRVLGEKVHKLVLGVQKIDLMLQANTSKNYPHTTIEANLQNLDKTLLMSMETTQAIVIRLAIQVCVMRDAMHADKNTKLDLAYQTQKIFAPLSKRLNIGSINWELEDLAFKFSNPDIYKKIANLLDERRGERENYILKIKQQLEERLKLHDINVNVFGRVKHIYSIWCKMQRKMIDYKAVYDLHAVRIIVPSIIDCYTALGVVHTLWQHVPQEFDDYISKPKDNGYKSLHTKIIGLDGKILEAQIRTPHMHLDAESGVAAHWRYKTEGEA